MATASVTNTFVAGTAAEAAEVNTNFTNLVTFLNNSVVHRDGSKAMTANFDAGSNKIVNLTAGTDATDAVNKTQMDTAITAGLDSRLGSGGTVVSDTTVAVTDGTGIVEISYGVTFASTPIVIPVNGDATAGGVWAWAIQARGLSSFFLKTNLGSGVSIRVDWIAVGDVA